MPSSDSFKLLIAAAKAGAESAWAELFHDLAGPVTAYLRSRGAYEAEDVTGQVFLELARSIHRFEGDRAAFRSWVFVIAHRRLIDERRA
ncbi:MAG: RNA polymerase sigma factor, partial [Acidimicrobiia bacterium]